MAEKYDPSLRALVDKAEADWGDPVKNRDGLIPYPGGDESLINKALYGIDILNGELIGIIGEEKHRKTTFALNIYYWVMAQRIPKEKPRMAYLTLESGQRPERVRDLFIAMAATEHLLAGGYTEQAVISPDFLRYNRRLPVQQGAVVQGMAKIREWPIYIYGPHGQQGDTRNPAAITRILEHEAEKGCRLVCLDHAQQVDLPGMSDYERLPVVVNMFASAIVKHGLAGILISQVSLTSLRAARDNSERLRAMGGKRLDEEANAIFETRKLDKANELKIALLASRRADAFEVSQQLNIESGLFTGPPKKIFNPRG